MQTCVHCNLKTNSNNKTYNKFEKLIGLVGKCMHIRIFANPPNLKINIERKNKIGVGMPKVNRGL